MNNKEKGKPILTEEAKVFIRKLKEHRLDDYLELSDFEKIWRAPRVPAYDVRQNIIDALNNGELSAPC